LLERFRVFERRDGACAFPSRLIVFVVLRERFGLAVDAQNRFVLVEFAGSFPPITFAG
jgi:hypothetical protein